MNNASAAAGLIHSAMLLHLHYLPLLLAISLEEFIESDHLILIVFRVLGASIGHRHHVAQLSTKLCSATKPMV